MLSVTKLVRAGRILTVVGAVATTVTVGAVAPAIAATPIAPNQSFAGQINGKKPELNKFFC